MIEANPPVIFNVSQSDLLKDYGWSAKDNEIKIKCNFPLKCEVSYDNNDQKTYLVVTLITQNPNSNHTFRIDFFDTTKDLVSLGYLNEEDYDTFINHIITNSPNRDTLNYLDSTGTTINEYSGKFELQQCVNQSGDICAVVLNSEENRIIAEIPVYPDNKLEFTIRQKNIEVEETPTRESKYSVVSGGLTSIAFLTAFLGPMLYIKYKLDLRNEKMEKEKILEEI